MESNNLEPTEGCPISIFKQISYSEMTKTRWYYGFALLKKQEREDKFLCFQPTIARGEKNPLMSQQNL